MASTTDQRRAHRAWVVSWACVLLFTSCTGVSTEGEASGSGAGETIEGLSGELILTRQRDLLDRGLINALTVNDSGSDLVISDRRLLADHFETEPAPDRRSGLRNGRQVRLQVPFGTVTDCDTADPVTARLALGVQAGDDPTVRPVEVELSGTGLLDGIRAEQCAGRALHDGFEVGFAATEVAGETVETELTIVRTTSDAPLTIHRVAGTILVAAELAASGPIELAASAEEVTIPLRFSVNRCDPHALAEVTKRYGLDLELSLRDGPAVPVEIDIEPLRSDLVAIVDACTARTGS